MKLAIGNDHVAIDMKNEIRAHLESRGIEVLDAGENVLFTKYVPDVPMQRNRKTTLTGAVYSASPTSVGFLLETSWIDGNTVTWSGASWVFTGSRRFWP